MTSIDQRFAVERTIGGDALGAWTTGLDEAFATMPAVRVHGVDLAHASRPRAVRALAHQRASVLQLALLRDAAARRMLVVVRLSDDGDHDRACVGIDAALRSVHRRVELLRGRPVAIAGLAVPRSAPAAAVRACILQGAPLLPDGAAAVTWDEARGHGLRAAVSLQSL